MSLLALVAASILYAVGGLFMKQSAGAARLVPTLGFLALFVSGALLQAWGMKDSDMGASYIFVLGVEAIAAVLIGAVLLHETFSWSRVAAIVLVIAGVAWLRRT